MKLAPFEEGSAFLNEEANSQREDMRRKKCQGER